jgi:Chaperone of endosialidase
MLDFPGPGGLTVGQVFTSAGKSWQWDGAKWGPAAGGGAPLDSPSFTGDPKAPTPATADNDTSIATTAFVKAQGYLINNQLITLSGDIAGSGATAIAATLATVNSNVGTFQGLTLDAKGRVTAAANQSYLTGNQSITLSGDISGSGATAITTILATVPVAKGGTGATTAPNALTNLGAVAKAGDTMTGTLTVNSGSGYAFSGISSQARIDGYFLSTTQLIGLNAIFDGAWRAIGTGWSSAFNQDQAGQWQLQCSTASVAAGAAPTMSPRIAVINSTGACQNTSGTWSALSDISLKEEVADYTASLTEIAQLRPVTWTWKDRAIGPGVNYGLIAQEVEPVMPELVGEASLAVGREGAESLVVKTIDYTRAIFAVFNALREVSERLSALEARLPPTVQGS